MKSDATLTNQDTERWQKSFEHKIEHEEEMIRSIPPNILRGIRGQFIAVSEGKIIDQDWDEILLAKRVSLLPKSKFILIHQVTEEDLRIS